MQGEMYFIAIIPPQEICISITNIKEEIASRFRSKHALRLIPHITLKAPFSVPKNQDEHVKNWFNNIPVSVAPFQQTLEGYNCFSSKRNPVIFINPVLGDSLKLLQKTVVNNFRKQFNDLPVSPNELDFHPHITIAYRDLSFDYFKVAWEEFRKRSFHAEFTVNNFHFLKHNGKQWDIIAENKL